MMLGFWHSFFSLKWGPCTSKGVLQRQNTAVWTKLSEKKELETRYPLSDIETYKHPKVIIMSAISELKCIIHYYTYIISISSYLVRAKFVTGDNDPYL